MSKHPLTVGDVGIIVEVLEENKNTIDDVAEKEKIDEIIKKLYALKVGIRSTPNE